MNLIHHINQPKRLLLAWQSLKGTRTRYVVGELCLDGGSCRFSYLPNTEDFVKAVDEGFVCYPAFRKLNQEYSEGVLETFMSRIPPRKRGDFNKYLAQWRLAPDLDISDFALLGHTGAKLPNDGFSLINPFENIDTSFEFYIEVAGFRYQENVCLDEVSIGMSVSFASEVGNVFDQHAVSINVLGNKIGYVNKIQSPAFKQWLEHYSIDACIERINGTSDRPLIYIFGKLQFENAQNIAA